jgi:hypothetical protein
VSNYSGGGGEIRKWVSRRKLFPPTQHNKTDLPFRPFAVTATVNYYVLTFQALRPSLQAANSQLLCGRGRVAGEIERCCALECWTLCCVAGTQHRGAWEAKAYMRRYFNRVLSSLALIPNKHVLGHAFSRS